MPLRSERRYRATNPPNPPKPLAPAANWKTWHACAASASSGRLHAGLAKAPESTLSAHGYRHRYGAEAAGRQAGAQRDPCSPTEAEPARVFCPGHSLHRRAPAIDPATSAAQWRASARSEEHTSELQSLMRISYAVFCLKKKKKNKNK